MEKCPKCGSSRIHRSRTRSALERLRRNVTGKAPFRCSACGWRGWSFDFGTHSSGAHDNEMPANEAHPVPDLTSLDEALGGRPPENDGS